MTTVTNQDVKIRRGDTCVIFVALTAADGTPYDPTTNAVIKWRLVPTSHATDDETMAAKDLDDGIEIVAGGVEISLDTVDTDYDPDIYYHELKVYDAGDVETSLCGVFVIKPSLQMGNVVMGRGSLVMLMGSAPVVG